VVSRPSLAPQPRLEDTKTSETSTPDKNVEKTTEEPTKPPAETPKAEKEE